MPRPSISILLIVLLAGLLAGCALFDNGRYGLERDEPLTSHPSNCNGTFVLASIGDFGSSGAPEAAVAELVASCEPDAVFTVGDNNYPDGEASTIDENIGQYYHQYIHPYQGEYGAGASENRFFPAMGNHDWDTGTPQPYLDYFALPGNERYYDFVRGPIHFFVLDSDAREPDGNTRDSVQADWLQENMDENQAPWRLVVLHHPPYSSSLFRGENEALQWPYARWGASAILGGHEHFYERGYVDGIPQFVVGLAGKWKGMNPIHRFDFQPIPGSQVRYNQDYGAMLVATNEQCINFSYFNRSAQLIDSYTMTQ